MNSYGVLIQASPEEILMAAEPSELNIIELGSWENISDVVVVLPEIKDVDLAVEKLKLWKVKFFVGNTYNVAKRLVEASIKFFPNQSFIVRVLCFWKNIDLKYVDLMVEQMANSSYDFVTGPIDFNITMCADIASIEKINEIADFEGDSPLINRARFNPFGFMDVNNQKYKVCYLEPAPKYSSEKVKQVLSSKRNHPENEFFGRDYAGSRYHFLIDYIPTGVKVLDIACGSGIGTNLISQKASFVLGCDYDSEYIKIAQDRFGHSEKMQFLRADGQSFLWEEGGFFDVIVSLHTLEHVPDDKKMLLALRNNLKDGGLLILEVPLLSNRPLGQPINPYHIKEYGFLEVHQLVEEFGFSIVRKIGCSRGFTTDANSARDAIQVHAVKL
ncbi:bifunctional glycosyltransferase/class I SAM-dependent methyltransferase [Aquaspirillum serpens]|uniref:bifunctional glycosyltransferase/class I SAM-dependent methyltransferase n=1 Tax=Aquaspirillum serpens TaxID=190 RepID=UPI0003B7A465|nr:bifunctional glycosyltransferase/class I SAM-dependent methyltransferase [Aquaspirillum serpens]